MHALDPTPLRTPHALAALWQAWGDVEAITRAMAAVATWGELACLSITDLARVVGPVAAAQLPPVCPPLPTLTPPGRVVTAVDPGWPPCVPATRWPVLYATGPIPTGPAVLVAGGPDPTPQGVEIARAAALAAAGEHLPLVASPTAGIGLIALRTAVAAGGVALAVLDHGLELPSTHVGLLAQVTRGGGAVVTLSQPTQPATPASAPAAAALMTHLASCAVLAEVGIPPAVGTDVAAAAIAAGMHLVVPPPPPHYTPAGASGLAVLTDATTFTPSWYGTNDRITARVTAGRPAADDTPSDGAAVAAAIRRACSVERLP